MHQFFDVQKLRLLNAEAEVFNRRMAEGFIRLASEFGRYRTAEREKTEVTEAPQPKPLERPNIEGMNHTARMRISLGAPPTPEQIIALTQYVLALEAIVSDAVQDAVILERDYIGAANHHEPEPQIIEWKDLRTNQLLFDWLERAKGVLL